MSQEQPKSASIIKSGFLWKKGEGILGQTYKERLFELKLTGKLDYFDVSSGKKIFKGTILLTSSSKIIIRKNLPSDQHKFVIKTQQREWHLWSRDQNAKQTVQQWYNLINDMINSSKSLTKNSQSQPDIENIHTNNSSDIIQQTNDSSPTPQDILAKHPTSSTQPFNPFYGGSISAASISVGTDEKQENISYYASLKPSKDTHSIGSAPTAPMEFEIENKDGLNEQFENMNIEIGFKISENVSLKSVLFGSWISYNIEGEYLYGVTISPMVNERFTFKCIDDTNDIYTIQTCNGLYLSAGMNGNVKFMKKCYGIYEQWIVKYKHINNIYIQSKYYQTYFGIDSNGLFHCKYTSMTAIIMFELSPPVIIHKNDTHFMNNNMNNISDKSIQYPTLNGIKIVFCCCINGNFIGIENINANKLKCDYTTYQSFDGNVMTRSIFNIIKDRNNYRLFAFKSLLNGKYLSVSDNINGGKIRFVSQLTEKEYFEVIWYDINIISLMAYNGTILCVGKDNILYNYNYNNNNGSIDSNYLFQIKSKSFDRINCDINNIPICQLPIRNINGQIKRDIWLKGHSGAIGYLAYRSKPYRYEAVSKIMGRWETIRFKHDLLNSNIKKECIVSLFTANGMIIACDCNGEILYLNGEDINDKWRCRWRIYFHNYALISIQNYKYKGWMILKKNMNQSNIYVLDIKNPKFDENGKPIIDVENARGFKNLYCQFELCPIANCKQSIDVSNKYKKQNSAVSFAM